MRRQAKLSAKLLPLLLVLAIVLIPSAAAAKTSYWDFGVSFSKLHHIRGDLYKTVACDNERDGAQVWSNVVKASGDHVFARARGYGDCSHNYFHAGHEPIKHRAEGHNFLHARYGDWKYH